MFFRAIYLDKTTVLIGQSEGLPNITGEAWIRLREATSTGESIGDTTGCFTRGENRNLDRANAHANQAFPTTKSLKLDASLSNPIYGNSNHVTPCNATIKVWQRVS